MPKKAKISNFELKNCYIPQKKAESMYNKDSTRKSNTSYKKKLKKKGSPISKSRDTFRRGFGNF